MKLEVLKLPVYDTIGENNFQPYDVSIYIPNIVSFRPFTQHGCNGTYIETIARPYLAVIPFNEFSNLYLKEHSFQKGPTE